MNIHDLRTAQAQFETQIEKVLKTRKELYALRDAFATYYTNERIRRMPLEHYALGNDLPKKGYHFCHTLERKLDGLGRTTGSTSLKFGVYYGVKGEDREYKYRHTKKFGNDYKSAFDEVKKEIIKLIEAGSKIDINAIIDNPISSMFKGKILSTYFPDQYLNVFSYEHLNYFLVQLNLDIEDLIEKDEVLKRKALIDFKNGDDVMRNWSVDLFSYFIYNYYPGRPPKGNMPLNPNEVLNDYRMPDFPEVTSPEWIDLTIQPPLPQKQIIHSKQPANPDYEKEARKLKKYGDRGEKIVLEMEKQRLIRLNKKGLADKVEKAEFDFDGYDILSYEIDESPRYIEVKATSSKVGSANFFLSANELKKANELTNYYIYVVYDILSASPKAWVIKNPFNPEDPNVVKTPISYKVSINATKS
jgi:hypothetical protein